MWVKDFNFLLARAWPKLEHHFVLCMDWGVPLKTSDLNAMGLVPDTKNSKFNNTLQFVVKGQMDMRENGHGHGHGYGHAHGHGWS